MGSKLNEIIFRQVPLPDPQKIIHPHQCSKCNKSNINGIVSYSNKLEKTVFICYKCQPIKLIPAQLPTKTEFRKNHECRKCHKKGKTGVLTYCSRCEEAEFVCPFCLEKWFNNIGPGEYGYENRTERMK